MTERQKFLHVQVDIDLFDHPKSAKVGAGGVGVFAAALAYCRKHQTDGRIPRKAVMTLLFGDGAKHFDDLVAIGWLIDLGEEVEVWNYVKKNQTKAEIEKAKASARDRMRRVRANADRTSGEQSLNAVEVFGERSGSGSFSDVDQDPGRKGSENEEQSTRQRTPGGDESGVHRAAVPRTDLGGLEAETWAEGIAEAVGTSASPPSGGEVRAIRAALAAHCPKGIDAAARAAWLRSTAREYAVANKGAVLDGWKFAAWLRSGRPLAGARAGPQRILQRPAAEGEYSWEQADAERRARSGSQ